MKPWVQVVWAALWPEIVDGSAMELGAGVALADGAADPDGVGVAGTAALGSAIAARPSLPVREIGWSEWSAAASAAAGATSGTTRLGLAG